MQAQLYDNAEGKKQTPLLNIGLHPETKTAFISFQMQIIHGDNDISLAGFISFGRN